VIKYGIDFIEEGMVLGRSIYGPKNELILAAGFRLTAPIIERLKQLRYFEIYIHEPGTDEVVPEDIVSEQVRREAEAEVSAMQNKATAILAIREESLDQVKKIVEEKSGAFKNIVLAPVLKERLSGIIENILSSPRSLLNLSAIKNMSSYRFQHAINTTVVALYLGLRNNFTLPELELLGMGTMLMDIGMIALPQQMLEKPGPLSQEEMLMVREHPNYGFLILGKNPALSPVVSAISFQHHERQDGAGYPRKLTGTNEIPIKRATFETQAVIHRFAEIAAVADAYDAITTERPHAKVKSPAQAVEELIKVAGSQLNKRIVETLIKSIPLFPVGAHILVSASVNREQVGYQGVVAEVDPEKPDRPVILLIRTKHGKAILPPQKIDMRKQQYLTIEVIV